jgi:hypothetical protein
MYDILAANSKGFVIRPPMLYLGENPTKAPCKSKKIFI